MSGGRSVQLAFQPFDCRIVRGIETDKDPDESVHRKQGLQRRRMAFFEGWVPLQRIEDDVFERHKARLLQAERGYCPYDVFEGAGTNGNLMRNMRAFAHVDLPLLKVTRSEVVILQSCVCQVTI